MPANTPSAASRTSGPGEDTLTNELIALSNLEDGVLDHAGGRLDARDVAGDGGGAQGFGRGGSRP